jgi:hypothetical protein
MMQEYAREFRTAPGELDALGTENWREETDRAVKADVKFVRRAITERGSIPELTDRIMRLYEKGEIKRPIELEYVRRIMKTLKAQLRN